MRDRSIDEPRYAEYQHGGRGGRDGDARPGGGGGAEDDGRWRYYRGEGLRRRRRFLLTVLAYGIIIDFSTEEFNIFQ